MSWPTVGLTTALTASVAVWAWLEMDRGGRGLWCRPSVLSLQSIFTSRRQVSAVRPSCHSRVEMERVLASASAFANKPQKFYIRIGIRIRDAADETYSLTFASAHWVRLIFAFASHPHHAEADARIIENLVILVYTIQNASDFLQKKQKSCY